MRRSFFNKTGQVYEPNFFIGGVGNTIITSAQDFADTCNIDVSYIEDFFIDSNYNVSFKLTYESLLNFKFYQFQNITEMTWFIDNSNLSGMISGRGWLNNSVNMVALWVPKEQNLGRSDNTSSMSGCSALKFYYAAGVTNSQDMGREFGKNWNSVKFIDVRHCTDFILYRTDSYKCFLNIPNLEYVNLESCVNLSYDYPLLGLGFVGINSDATFILNPSFDYNDRESWLVVDRAYNVGDVVVINGLTYTATESTNNNSTGEFAVGSISPGNGVRNLFLRIYDDTRTGTLGKVYAKSYYTSLMLRSDQSGASANTITYQVNSETPINFIGGLNSQHPLVDRLESQGCTVVFKQPTDYTLPIAPVGLNVSGITSTSVYLNFTDSSSSVNNIIAYEVWVDDGYHPWMKFVQYEWILASGDTLDLSYINNALGSISGTKIKIRAVDEFTNYSPFSNEITIP